MRTYAQNLTPAWMQLIDERGEERQATAVAAHRHLWVALTSFFVDPPLRDADVVFDADTMVHSPVVACLICEESWTPWRYRHRCKGDPKARPW